MLFIMCVIWRMEMLDVKDAFLKGDFWEDKEEVFLEVPQGFEHIYTQFAIELETKLVKPEDALK